MADVAAAEQKLRDAFDRAKQHMDPAKREAWAKARKRWRVIKGKEEAADQALAGEEDNESAAALHSALEKLLAEARTELDRAWKDAWESVPAADRTAYEEAVRAWIEELVKALLGH